MFAWVLNTPKTLDNLLLNIIAKNNDEEVICILKEFSGNQ